MSDRKGAAVLGLTSEGSSARRGETEVPGARRRAGQRSDFFYYGLRNRKLAFGLGLELLLVLFAIIGPMIAKYAPQALTGVQLARPSATHWLGTDDLGEDIYSQLANGLRESYLVGALGAVSASVVGMALGFAAGWRGGILDEVLQMITNIIVMLPSLVLLVVIGSYLNSRSVLFEGVFIGLTTWPWVARAVRAQTFSLRSREFVEMAKLSGRRPLEIIVKDIAPNMASYLFLVVILLFGSSMLLAASYDFLGLGPSNVVSLGNMMNQAQGHAALLYREWWWFVPPGAVLTAMVAALLIANVGLDEVFNPKLRQQ
ncbi:MAG: ABC transporter permease [Trebonia sp.]|jgi:peptide/nickel transport system permease protein